MYGGSPERLNTPALPCLLRAASSRDTAQARSASPQYTLFAVPRALRRPVLLCLG